MTRLWLRSGAVTVRRSRPVPVVLVRAVIALQYRAGPNAEVKESKWTAPSGEGPEPTPRRTRIPFRAIYPVSPYMWW
jgi:hypothetical protein